MALLASAALTLGQAPHAAADSVPGSYVGPGYSDALLEQPAPGPSPAPTPAPQPPSPTRAENQHKLWFHAGSWWALMLDPTGRTVRVFELMVDHTWHPTSTVIDADAGDIGDALPDGDAVHVLSRSRDGSLHYVHLVFDLAAREYRVGPSVLVTARGSQSPASLAEDSTGRLWVAYATATNVVVTYSDTGGRTWGKITVFARTGTGTTPETAALVAYDDRVGLLWSNQAIGSFLFASHHDGDLPDVWRGEQALAGNLMANDHISLARVAGEPSDTLVAAVMTSQGDQPETDAPQVELLVRSPDGQWTPHVVSTVADGLGSPVVQVDETTRTVYVFASGHGDVVEKHTSLDDIRFEPGPGAVFVAGVGGRLLDPTVTQGPVNAESGLVVLASDAEHRTYRHAELPIASPTPLVHPDDHAAPATPSGLTARALSPQAVLLSWSTATDEVRWVPAGDGVPAAGYVVLRDGVQVATVTDTSMQDHLRAEGDATADASVHYEVIAVDDAGNRSAPTSVVVEVPGTAQSGTTRLIGTGLMILAAVTIGLYAVRHRRLARTMRDRERPARLPATEDRLARSAR
jgi:hypothetical protein